MRLTRPTLGQTVIVQSEPGCRDLEGDTLQAGLAGDINTAVRLPALQPGGCLVLPQVRTDIKSAVFVTSSCAVVW